MKTKYIVKRYDIIRNQYVYYNCFSNYKDAAQARDDLQRRYGGRFEIFQAEED